MKKNFLLLICFLTLPAIYSFNYVFNISKADKNQVLVYSRTKGYRHKSIEKGIEAIKKIEQAILKLPQQKIQLCLMIWN